MLKVETAHGSHYFIDQDLKCMMRVRGEGRQSLDVDDEWVPFETVDAYDIESMKRCGDITVGKPMLFILRGMSSWIVSTPVISIYQRRTR